MEVNNRTVKVILVLERDEAIELIHSIEKLWKKDDNMKALYRELMEAFKGEEI